MLSLEEGKVFSRLHKLREEANYGMDRDYAGCATFQLPSIPAF